MIVSNPFSAKYDDISLDDCIDLYSMKDPNPIKDVHDEIENSLIHPICSDSLYEIACRKRAIAPEKKAVIVISDNTRPVPYKGDSGLLIPILDTLNKAGYENKDILILVATGMHRPMSENELRAILDEKVFERGIRILNHEPKNRDLLEYVGQTSRGTQAYIDSRYMDAGLKIVTGLVESHFMAGASGGRKAICPGLIGEESTYVFHGPELMADRNSRDLNLEGNPVHEESLAVARLAGIDFLVNVTLDGNFRITGIFAGDFEKAHEMAVEALKHEVRIDIPKKYDVVITHGGFVGINHYQCAKGAVASMGALKENGYLIEIADCTDAKGVIGSPNYRVCLGLLHLIGPDCFLKEITGKDWTFLPEQWQVQQWAKVFSHIGENHFYYYAPQIGSEEFALLPGLDIASISKVCVHDHQSAIECALADICNRTGKTMKELDICYLMDGPYAIPQVTN